MGYRKKRLLPALTRYANIIFFKAYANIKAEVEKTYLGCLWWFLEPLLQTAIFFVIFDFLKPNTKLNPAFVFVGMTVYNYFSNAVNMGSVSLVQNADLMRQVYLPKPVFVLITLTNLTWKFLFSLLLVLPLVWWSGGRVSLPYLALPLLIALQIVVAVGLVLPLAAWLPYFQDGKTVLATVMNVGMWFSGVLIPPANVAEQFRQWLYLNPIVTLNEAYRSILLTGVWPEWRHFFWSAPVVVFAWIVGVVVMWRIDRKVPKVNI